MEQQLNGGNGQVPEARCGDRQKKPFASRKEAEQFEVENRTRFPNQSRQYAYPCTECPAYHLTSKPLDAYAMGPGNLKRLEGLAPETTSKTPKKRGRRGQTEGEVKDLWTQGMSDTAIASQLGVCIQTVYYHRKKLGTAKSRTGHKSVLHEGKLPLTILEADEQKRLLEADHQAKLLLLDLHRQRLVEANRVTVSECPDGQALSLKFGQHEHMIVPKWKIEELTISLMQWV